MLHTGELIVDHFAGGGGVATGVQMATGRPVDIAVNHDEDALVLHIENYPDTKHYCESVWEVDPYEATAGRKIALCWFSPDCKHFSKAKGDKPREKHIRGLAWVAVRWAATVRPRVIMLENVEEFKEWGPLLANGKPDPKQKGRTFRSFVNALKLHGYEVEWRELKACDYGAPTTRKRFFLIARSDGKAIAWPKATHGKKDSLAVQSGKLQPYRTAAEILDFTRPCQSIFKRKKPLSQNTMRRIAYGIERFVLKNDKPFIIKVNHGGKQFRGQPIDQPIQTITTKNGWGLVQPYLSQVSQTLAAPTLIQMGYGEANGQKPRVLDIHQPIGTITAGGNKFAVAEARLAPAEDDILAASHIIKMRGTNLGHAVTEPLHTITAGGNHFGEVRTFLKAYGSESQPDETLGLITIDGVLYQIVDIGMRMLEPYELFAAQGFPKGYIIDRVNNGKKAYSKASQVARCGNSVSPVIPYHLVKSNLPELCAQSRTDSITACWKVNGQYELALSSG
ncbi:DNA cytosine methyltransferase [Paenibacillus sp. N10]|uniref:DNA (cytosine-5-)-methyltransferase n=1 Tax=Paenibacillus lutrae TaxID=2078573 RepID=A0A7X3FM14_9BACL|nr:DNA cytosine methyltransferase [Paenibacillus lutrae]MVP02088.1 DNA cytosine methyltransferase [Paenibacillus lutrae]